MKIAIVTSNSNSIINFRYNLIKKLILNGFDVSVLSSDGNRFSELNDLDIKFFNLDYNNRNYNPFKSVKYYRKIKKILKMINPEIIFTFQLQPNIFAQFAGNNIDNRFAMIEGLGDAFDESLFWRIVNIPVALMLKKSLKGVKKIFVLNREDKLDLVNKSIISLENIFEIPGIGVDLNKFKFVSRNTEKISFLMMARLIKKKGLYYFLEASKVLKNKYNEIEFFLVGSTSKKNYKIIQKYVKLGYVKYESFSNNPFLTLSQHSVFVLPSYYKEGLPMSIMEAMSTGMPIITTFNRGCNQTVENGFNGYLINKKSLNELIGAMEKIISDPEKISEFGKMSRQLAEMNFDQNLINNSIIEVVKNSINLD
jgi:glycosyltransferase involved in cell wall biosynthesis